MSDLELIAVVLRTLATIVLYALVGFGPGFLLGLLAANALLARGKPTIMDDYAEAKKMAAQHNAQWDPSNERWQQENIKSSAPISIDEPE